MDFMTLGKRLQNGSYYIALDIFVADMRRIFSNCRLYNAPDSIYFKLGSSLEAYFDDFLYAHVVIDGPPA